MLNKKLEALKAYLITVSEAESVDLEAVTVENSYNDNYNTFEIVGNEYKVLTDAEADAEAKKEILNSLWAFNADFILTHTEFYNTSSDREDAEFIDCLQKLQSNICESANSIVKALIVDIDTFIKDAIESDGRGHFISWYDGEEAEQGDFYIYRTN